MAKVEIISGFLGAGKTTWIKKALKEAHKDEKCMLIENEFGDIGVDAGFLQDAGVQITELNSGCICCTLVGDFVTALQKAVKEYDPELILIEPSGVGKLSDILKAITEAEDAGLTVKGSLTIVDAKKAKMYLRNFREFFVDQIQYADVVVLSHTKGLAPEKLEEVRKIIEEANPKAAIVTTEWEEFDAKIVEDLLEKGDTMREEMLEEIRKRPAHHHHHHHHRHNHDHEHEHEDEDEHEHHHHHHDDEEDEEDEHEHHHHHHGHECCCGEEDEECECCHEDDEEECECCHHHHDDDDEEEDEHEHHHHHHDEDEEEDADDVFDTYGFETAKTYSLEKISSILDVIMYDEDLFEHVLRAKGIVKSDKGEWIHFDYVPGEPDVHVGPAAYTGKVCIIGTDLDKEKLSGLFEEK